MRGANMLVAGFVLAHCASAAHTPCPPGGSVIDAGGGLAFARARGKPKSFRAVGILVQGPPAQGLLDPAACAALCRRGPGDGGACEAFSYKADGGSCKLLTQRWKEYDTDPGAHASLCRVVPAPPSPSPSPAAYLCCPTAA